jgi:hypothetical protein
LEKNIKFRTKKIGGTAGLSDDKRGVGVFRNEIIAGCGGILKATKR